jgi:hypothetical protein
MTSKNKQIIAGIASVLGLALLSYSASAQNSEGVNSAREILITDHDKVWDYKITNGVWFTRKKGTEEWLNMKSKLAESAYKLAIERLNMFIKSRGYDQTV